MHASSPPGRRWCTSSSTTRRDFLLEVARRRRDSPGGRSHRPRAPAAAETRGTTETATSSAATRASGPIPSRSRRNMPAAQGTGRLGGVNRCAAPKCRAPESATCPYNRVRAAFVQSEGGNHAIRHHDGPVRPRGRRVRAAESQGIGGNPPPSGERSTGHVQSPRRRLGTAHGAGGPAPLPFCRRRDLIGPAAAVVLLLLVVMKDGLSPLEACDRWPRAGSRTGTSSPSTY